MKYHANNTVSVKKLAETINGLSRAKKVDLILFMITNTLIKPPFQVRFGMWLVDLIKGRDAVYLFLHRVFQDDKILNDCISQINHHVVHGKDQIDPDSKGGFSQQELNSLLCFFPEPNVSAGTTEFPSF